MAEAVAERTQTELFNVNGELYQLTEGRLVAINKDILRDIVARHLVSPRLVNRGSTSAPVWEVEKFSFDFPVVADTREQPDQRVVLNLINALVALVAKGPTQPRVLTPQQLREVHDRLKIGEPKEAIARAYNVDVAVIRQMAS